MSFRPFTSSVPTKITATAGNPGTSESPARADHIHQISLLAPLSFDGSGNLNMSQASGASNGWLSSTDWTRFNNASSGGWGLTGNSGTASGTNFLGTTDNVSLRFRVNNVEQIELSTSGALRLGNIGAGGILGSERLIINDTDGALSDFSFAVAGNGYPALSIGSSGGTPTARTISQNNQILGTWRWYGYDGAAWILGAELSTKTGIVASGNLNPTTTFAVQGTTVWTASISGLDLSGTPTAPTAAAGTNTTQIATTAFVAAAGVAQPIAQIAFGNATGTGLTSSANFTWDSIAGLSVAGPAAVTGNLTVSADAQIAAKVRLNAIADPVAPPANTGYLYARSFAGKIVPKWIGPSGLDFLLQTHIGLDKISLWSPIGNATTAPNLFGGARAFTTVGTATARNVATTNMAARAKRLGYVSSNTSGSLASIRTAVAQYTLGVPGGGSVPDLGGFLMIIRFVPSDASAVSGERFFAGVWSSTGAPTNVEPSTLTNAIGLAQLSTSSNLQIVYGGSAAQTPINLGANFPATGLSTDIYDFILWAPPNSNNTVYYEVVRLNTKDRISGILTAATPGTQLPANTTLLSAPVIWKTNNASSSPVGFDLVSAYIATDQ
jgi:hypothetical protein